MKKRLLVCLLIAGVIAIGLSIRFNLPAAASTDPGQGLTRVINPISHRSRVNSELLLQSVKAISVITLTKLEPIGLGEAFILDGMIKDATGKPIKDYPIQFKLNEQYLGQARSDQYGHFQRKFNKNLDSGSYSIEAYWNGSHDYEPASSAISLQVTPAIVRIQTVPATAGLPFTLADQRVVSGEDGYAVFKVNQAGEYRLNVLVEQYQNPTQRINFGRWLNEFFDPTTTIQVPTVKVVQVGLDVYRQVGQSFLDLDGVRVAPQRITEFMIRSAQGDVFIFHDGQPRWIPSSRIARRVTGLEETKLLYSVISVTVDGSNVVNQSQQRFYTTPTENWSISLLLYSLRITAKDGLFGGPVGKSVNVEFPDGHIVNYPLDKDGTVLIHSLARGNYFTELVGTFGLRNRTPVALSRNQDVNTNVITYLDLTVVGFLAALIALGLLLTGRPGLFYVLRRVHWSPRPDFKQGTGIASSQWIPMSGTNLEPDGQIYDYRDLRYESVRMFNDEEFKRSTGIERELFEKMLSILHKETQKSGRKTKLSWADQLLLTLVILRENPEVLAIAPAYGISVGTVRRSFNRVREALVKSGEFNTVSNLFQPAPLLLAVSAGADSFGRAVETEISNRVTSL